MKEAKPRRKFNFGGAVNPNLQTATASGMQARRPDDDEQHLGSRGLARDAKRAARDLAHQQQIDSRRQMQHEQHKQRKDQMRQEELARKTQQAAMQQKFMQDQAARDANMARAKQQTLGQPYYKIDPATGKTYQAGITTQENIDNGYAKGGAVKSKEYRGGGIAQRGLGLSGKSKKN